MIVNPRPRSELVEMLLETRKERDEAQARVEVLEGDNEPMVDFIRRVIENEGINFARHCAKPPPEWEEDRLEHRKEAMEIAASLRGEGGPDGA